MKQKQKALIISTHSGSARAEGINELNDCLVDGWQVVRTERINNGNDGYGSILVIIEK